jgi:hypothetical protein
VNAPDFEPAPGGFDVLVADTVIELRVEVAAAEAWLADHFDEMSSEFCAEAAEFVHGLRRSLDLMAAGQAISLDAMVNGRTDEHTRRFQALTRQLHDEENPA